jgi:hypothetical protein
MVDFRKLGDKAKELVQKRGGTDGLKQDAAELKEIATGKGSLSDKAKAAAEALKKPGGEAEGAAEAKPEAVTPKPALAEPTEPPLTAEERAERKARRAERRKERAEHHERGGNAA